MIFALTVAVTNFACAEDFYACTIKDVELYVYDIDFDANPQSDMGFTTYGPYSAFDLSWGVTPAEANAAFIAKVKFVQNGKIISASYSWRFVEHNGFIYFLALQNGRVIPGSRFGTLDIDEGAAAIYSAATKYIEALKYAKETEKIIGQIKPLFENRNFSEAMNLCNNVIQRHPDKGLGYYGLVFCYYLHGKYFDAVEQLKKSVSLTPTNADAYRFLGLSYSGINDANNAVESFNKAISINPRDHQSYYFAALVYTNVLKDYKKGVEYCEKAIELYPRRESDYYYVLGCCYSYTKQNEKALEAFKVALKLNPDNKLAKAAIESYPGKK